MTQLLATVFLVVALVATYTQPAQAAQPSRCRVDIYTARSGDTTTDVFVGNKAQGDTLTASYMDYGSAKTMTLYFGWNHIGTNVSGVVVTDKAGKKVC